MFLSSGVTKIVFCEISACAKSNSTFSLPVVRGLPDPFLQITYKNKVISLFLIGLKQTPCYRISIRLKKHGPTD
ncbi:hypothetical protein EO92_13580 [Methanosarcina sp. 2.H.A.1B.4]|nr:hypothetical protein EO92_13580 [Methanosarcina sp. 2.H.A.1B.4]